MLNSWMSPFCSQVWDAWAPDACGMAEGVAFGVFWTQSRCCASEKLAEAAGCCPGQAGHPGEGAKHTCVLAAAWPLGHASWCSNATLTARRAPHLCDPQHCPFVDQELDVAGASVVCSLDGLLHTFMANYFDAPIAGADLHFRCQGCSLPRCRCKSRMCKGHQHVYASTCPDTPSPHWQSEECTLTVHWTDYYRK